MASDEVVGLSKGRGRGRGRGKLLGPGGKVEVREEVRKTATAAEGQFENAKETPKLVLKKVTVKQVCHKSKRIRAQVSGESSEKASYKVSVLTTPELSEWEVDNPVLSEMNDGMLKALLHALGVQLGVELEAYVGKGKDGEVVIQFDVLQDPLKPWFQLAGGFVTAPRIETDYEKGFITHVERSGHVHYVYYSEVVPGLRETIRRYQKKKNLYWPTCTSVSCAFLGKYADFGVNRFLAPLDQTFSELTRVEVIGLGDEPLTVSVVYLDIGKVAKIRIDELVASVGSGRTPVMIREVPPLAIRAALENFDAIPSGDFMKNAKNDLYERFCFVKMIDADSSPPVVDILIPHGLGNGLVRLSDYFSNYGDLDIPPVPGVDSTELLNLQNELHDSEETWREFAEKQKTETTKRDCVCCKSDTYSISDLESEPVTRYPSMSAVLKKYNRNKYW